MPECVLPDFTRSLRGLAVPSAAGSAHDWVCNRLIQARTAANRVHTVEVQVAAFDAVRLERGFRDAITGLQGGATTTRAAAADDCNRAWERWVLAVQRVFDTADDWSRAVLPGLGDARGRNGGFWRCLLRRN